ncbi:MAG: hypothetical protein PHS01_11870 [Dysgonamonadaceae bacterium]|nr:hypothetical protein [Dysgonamonadaceae bacterium]
MSDTTIPLAPSANASRTVADPIESKPGIAETEPVTTTTLPSNLPIIDSTFLKFFLSGIFTYDRGVFPTGNLFALLLPPFSQKK